MGKESLLLKSDASSEMVFLWGSKREEEEDREKSRNGAVVQGLGLL